MTTHCHGVRHTAVSELEELVKTTVITNHSMPRYFNSLLSVCTCKCTHTCHSVQVEVRGQPTMSVLSSYLVDPKNQIQIQD